MAAITLCRKISIVRTMKRSGLTPHLASATLFLLGAGHVMAAEKNPATSAAAPAAETAESASARMKRFDKDGDGMLDDAERAAAKEALKREPLEPQKSRAAGSLAGQDGFRQKMVGMFDKNKDGRLDEEERAVAQKFAAERGAAGRGEMREEVMKRFDKNGDGQLDGAEREAAQRYMRERMEKSVAATAPANDHAALENVLRTAVEGNAAQLRRFDADKNGKLDDQEWSAARTEIQKWAAGAPHEKAVAGRSSEKEPKKSGAMGSEMESRGEMRAKPKKKEKN